MLKVLSSILCDLDPKVKALGQKAGICDGVPSTSALVIYWFIKFHLIFCSRGKTNNVKTALINPLFFVFLASVFVTTL